MEFICFFISLLLVFPFIAIMFKYFDLKKEIGKIKKELSQTHHDLEQIKRVLYQQKIIKMTSGHTIQTIDACFMADYNYDILYPVISKIQEKEIMCLNEIDNKLYKLFKYFNLELVHKEEKLVLQKKKEGHE